MHNVFFAKFLFLPTLIEMLLCLAGNVKHQVETFLWQGVLRGSVICHGSNIHLKMTVAQKEGLTFQTAQKFPCGSTVEDVGKELLDRPPDHCR